jgi:hypothetical protein
MVTRSRTVAKRASTRTVILTAGVLLLLVLSPVAGVAAARPLTSLTGSSLPRSLEGLGQPTEGFGIEGSQSGCYGYKSVAEGAHDICLLWDNLDLGLAPWGPLPQFQRFGWIGRFGRGPGVPLVHRLDW